jgi:DNA polymerase-3 subunit beta
VSTRVIPGDYPQTKSIIPQTFNYVLDVNARELLNAMDRVSILSSDKESVVRLSMTEDRVELTVRSDANGSAVEALQTFQFTGERLDVSFNSAFVVDAVKALKSEDVSVCFLAEMKPFVVKNKQDDSVVELITPMRTY